MQAKKGKVSPVVQSSEGTHPMMTKSLSVTQNLRMYIFPAKRDI